MIRDESGAALGELLVVLVISGMLLAGTIGMVHTTVRLLNAAPTDTNPHSYGALASAVAALETRATGQQSCTNPAAATTRTDCLDVTNNDARPVPPGARPGVCWVIVIEDPAGADGRRLECWELQTETGELVAHRYTHNETDNDAKLLPPEQVRDLLSIGTWQSTAAETLPLVSGLASVEWRCLTAAEVVARAAFLADPDNSPPLVLVDGSCKRTGSPASVELVACAAIRPDQRPTLDDIPLCDGNTVPRLDQPEPRPGEGYAMPALAVAL